MPHTLVAFVETQTSTALVNVAGLADPHVRVVGDDIYVPAALPFLAGVEFIGSTTTQAQIASPTLRRLANIDIEPIDTATEPGSPPVLHDYFAAPKALEGGEALNALMANSAAGYTHVLVWFAEGPQAPVTGEIFTIRATNSTTLTAYAWTNGALTFSQTLPRGTYQIVGMRAQSAGLLAARLVIPGFSWRPGCIGCDADADLDHPTFRRGRIGVWGEFSHDSPPTVDFLSVSADTAQVIHLDLIKTA